MTQQSLITRLRMYEEALVIGCAAAALVDVPLAEFNRMHSALSDLRELIKEAEGQKNCGKVVWESGRALQIDSFATGRPQAGMSWLREDGIHVEVTDGNSSWKGTIDLPKRWNP